MLEKDVDEKYFVSEKALDYILSTGTKSYFYKPEIDLDVARPLTSTMHKSHRACQDNYVSESFVKNNIKMEISDCLYIKEATEKGFKEAHNGDYVNIQFPGSKTRRGRVGEQIANTLLCNDAQGVVVNCIDKSTNNPRIIDIANCITAREDRGFSHRKGEGTAVVEQSEKLRIRKLTPKECFRLMGFDDKDCDILMMNKISNTQLYRMAGNSIVVDVLENLFSELFSQYNGTKQSVNLEKWYLSSEWEKRQMTIFDLINEKA